MLRSGVRLLVKRGTNAVVQGARTSPVFVRAAAAREMSTAGDVYARTGLDPNIFKDRTVVIFKPPASPTQCGPSRAHWKIQ